MSTLQVVDPADVYACSSCGGDQHAEWICPSCNHGNIDYAWWAEESKQVCKECGSAFILSGKYPD
jgi:hypothetical protein